jgi:hypothetical protein
MAFDTIQSPVYAFKGISRGGFMIPFIRCHMFPRERLVTVGAMRAQPKFIAVVLAAFPVTDFARHGCPFEDAIYMTLFTRDRSVFSNKRKIRPVVTLGAPLYCVLFSS